MKAKKLIGVLAGAALTMSTVFGSAMPVFADAEVASTSENTTQGNNDAPGETGSTGGSQEGAEQNTQPNTDAGQDIQTDSGAVENTQPDAGAGQDGSNVVQGTQSNATGAMDTGANASGDEQQSNESQGNESQGNAQEDDQAEGQEDEGTEQSAEQEESSDSTETDQNSGSEEFSSSMLNELSDDEGEVGIGFDSYDNSQAANDTRPVYTPITLDGDFSDWEGHQTTAVNDGKLSDMDMVWSEDGGLCIYLKEADGQWHGVASNTGERNNGQYVITSDTGRQFVFQLKYENGKAWAEDGKGNKLDGVTVVCKVGQTNNEFDQYDPKGNQYEIKLDPGLLKTYNQSVSLGYYLAKDQSIIVSDVANPYLSEQAQVGDLVADGNFGDWDHYDHELIEYSKAYADSEGALYSDGNTLLMHVATYKDQRVTNLYNDITVRFNENDNQRVNLKLAVADAAGNLSYPNDLWDSTPGKTYTYYLIDEDGWNLWSNIDKNVNSETFGYGNGAKQQWLYGKIIVKVTATGTEMEVESNMAEYADRLNLDQTSLKRIEAYFENIGQTWISCAGTSTGPVPGILMGAGIAVIAAWGYKKKEKGEVQA